ncbi:hypothetical protein O3M35_010016 [Rhynocoris fuscipes]|uniref:Mediator of RNA polymerase II transcription subunit 20 n=1 Tax=Rhynocoris fuscipes TaxID=488301 RepID=A0AAW1D4J2_9HEMI
MPSLGPQRTVHVLHNSEQPASVFSLLETGTKTIPLVADGLFDLLMLKMTPIYTKKQGVLVEVEYRPCVVPSSCAGLLREFLQGFLGSCVQALPSYLQSRMDDIYQPLDTVQQYLEHFTMYRKATFAV